MSYKTLLVHLDEQARCPVRVALAAAWARLHEAHLVGLSPTGLLDMPGQVGPALGGSANYIQLSLEYLEKRAQEIAEHFEQQARRLQLPSYEVRTPRAEALNATVVQARSADLVVIGQSDPDVKGAVARDFPQQVLLHAGRPVLVVPYTGSTESVGRVVLAAWHPGRESARAMSDALPVLQRAEQIHLVHFCGSSAEGAEQRLAFDECVRWLARHGVTVRASIEVTGIDPGNALLSRAADVSADLLVMGGYGHSRLREFVLGGVTRTVLAHMTLPVLMSH